MVIDHHFVRGRLRHKVAALGVAAMALCAGSSWQPVQAAHWKLKVVMEGSNRSQYAQTGQATNTQDGTWAKPWFPPGTPDANVYDADGNGVVTPYLPSAGYESRSGSTSSLPTAEAWSMGTMKVVGEWVLDPGETTLPPVPKSLNFTVRVQLGGGASGYAGTKFKLDTGMGSIQPAPIVVRTNPEQEPAHYSGQGHVDSGTRFIQVPTHGKTKVEWTSEQIELSEGQDAVTLSQSYTGLTAQGRIGDGSSIRIARDNRTVTISSDLETKYKFPQPYLQQNTPDNKTYLGFLKKHYTMTATEEALASFIGGVARYTVSAKKPDGSAAFANQTYTWSAQGAHKSVYVPEDATAEQRKELEVEPSHATKNLHLNFGDDWSQVQHADGYTTEVIKSEVSGNETDGSVSKAQAQVTVHWYSSKLLELANNEPQDWDPADQTIEDYILARRQVIEQGAKLSSSAFGVYGIAATVIMPDPLMGAFKGVQFCALSIRAARNAGGVRGLLGILKSQLVKQADYDTIKGALIVKHNAHPTQTAERVSDVLRQRGVAKTHPASEFGGANPSMNWPTTSAISSMGVSGTSTRPGRCQAREFGAALKLTSLMALPLTTDVRSSVRTKRQTNWWPWGTKWSRILLNLPTAKSPITESGARCSIATHRQVRVPPASGSTSTKGRFPRARPTGSC